MFEWESSFEPHILERGWNYYKKGSVKHLVRKDGRIEAVVTGSEYYRVSMEYDGHNVSGAYCSCPYAAGGNMCKHMAAVLYEADQSNNRRDESISPGAEESDVFSNLADVLPIAKIIREADRNKLEELLIEFADRDCKIENYIRATLSGMGSPIKLREIKKEISAIFSAHTGRGGYIDYNSAFDLASELCTYLWNMAERLIDTGQYFDAFEMTVYALEKLDNYSIDDDGQIADISDTGYSIWQSIIAKCPEEEKRRIKRWFIQKNEDENVVFYLNDSIQEFLRYELATEEELHQEIDALDLLIEESRGSTKCKYVYTQHYGYSMEAIDMRIYLMKKLEMGEKDIDEFRREHLNFQSVRKHFIDKAQAEGNIEEEILLLKTSKALDRDSAFLVNSYSQRLIDLYHSRGELDLEKEERRESFLAYRLATVEDFRAYREMCSEDEWKRERVCLIESRDDIDKRCELYAEEKMLTELYELISSSKNKLAQCNKYGFLLAEKYSEQILDVYQCYVLELADTARSRSAYDELIRYLKRMQQYDGGREMVQSLCDEWIEKYPTRRVMVQELSEFALSR